MRLLPFLLATLVAALGAVAAYSGHIVHERRDILPNAWSKIARLGGQEVLPVRIGLAQSNLDKGHDLLMEISDPGSPTYGKHLSPEQVHDLFAPAGESVDRVRAWLEEEGIDGDRVSQSVNKQWLQFDASAREMERLLRAEYYLYSHAESGRSHIACREYHIPLSLQSHIDYITPGVKLQEVAPSHKRRQKRDDTDILVPGPIIGTDIELADLLKDVLGYCDEVVTPACIQLMYNITEGATAARGNELGIFETLGDVYSQTDLDLFFSTLASNIPKDTHPVHKLINGATAPESVVNSGSESALDFQVSYPLIWPQNSVLFQTDDPVYQANYTFDGILNNFLDAIDGSYCDASEEALDAPYPNPAPGGYKGEKQCGVYNPTNVISISYGAAESSLPIRYIRRQCNEWMKLSLQGVSIVVASGDNGVAVDNKDSCLGENGTVFQPDFPAICPYITTVGGTTLPKGGDPYNPNEIAAASYGSGGGFSNVFERPEYQRAAVEEYFSRVDLNYPYYESVDNSSFAQNGGIYNRIGRAYPDVSAIGEHILVFWKGGPVVGGGTSASAPIFAAMLTRINEERIAAGRPTVGFVNPLLYAHPEVFRDVTEGSNPACKSDGFPAAPGWDPVTGLGSPKYDRMLELFMGV